MAELNLQVSETAMPRRMTWAVVLGLWTIPGLTALSYYYLNQVVTAQPMVWRFALVSTLPNWYIWAAFTPMIVWVARRYRLEDGQWKSNFFAVHLPVMVLCMLIHSLVNLLLFRATGLHDTVNATLYGVHFTSRAYANVLTYWTVLGLYYAQDYYRKFQSREQQTALLQLQVAEANLRALKMQLHPHFLFNTLHSIAALVRKSENRTAIKMLVKLGDFLRLALENKGVQEIPLAQELDFLERYLEIEKVRFQDRLRVDIDVGAGVMEAMVPNMLLQPLVENALYHGIAPHASGGCIEIHARHEDGTLVLRVRDDGPGLQPDQPRRKKKGGVGLANTRERLDNLYGRAHRITMGNAEEGGYEVVIHLPFSTTPARAQRLRDA